MASSSSILLLALLALLAVFASTTAAASERQVDNKIRTMELVDKPLHVSTQELPDSSETVDSESDDDEDDDESKLNGGLGYEPVTVFDGRLAVPEWAVCVYQAVTGRRLSRTLRDAPHDAPVSPRAPLHLPRHLHAARGEGAKAARARRSADDAHVDERSGESVMVKGEWLVMVSKSHRNDFASVLDDMGDHLNKRFGMTQWFDMDTIRASKRAHDERQLRRRAAGEDEEKPWTVQAEANGHMALEFGQRMLVKVAVPESLHHRQYDIVESLRDKEWTQFIEPNLVMRTTATQSLDSSDNLYPWGLDRIDQRDLPLNDKYTYVSPTSNVRIYVVDTGILTTHQEFGGRATWGTNTVGDGKDYDCYGHGTHVAGIAVGSTKGVAKDVDVVAVKALGCDGSGTSASVIQGVNWAINDCPSGTKCIVSMSLGGKDTSLALDDIVKTAYNDGLVVVSAAGNSNVDACGISPARSPYGITVGATTQDDAKAFFSNYGGCVNIWAPGLYIPSSYYTGNNIYAILSGTSQATPHVTGAVAVYLGATKSVSPSEAAGAIYASASLNRVTGTSSGSVNRLLYSQVDLGAVPQTAAAACSGIYTCQTVNGTLTSGSTVYVPSGQFTVTSTEYFYGYIQGWLEASDSFDLQLQYYSGSSWSTVATSSGGSGSEWMQFATSATGAGKYRFAIVASLGESGTYQFSYQEPSSLQAGEAREGGAASTSVPFWLPLLRAFFFF